MKRSFISILFGVLFYISVPGQSFQVDTIIYNGNIDNRINIVFLGDGYTEGELDKYINDVKSYTDSIFSKIPFSEYKNYFNVFAVKVPSNVSGAATSPDNLIDNYFGSTFWYAGIERLLVSVYNSKISNVLADYFPSYDQPIMLVNSSKFGGSGGWIATSSKHEMAHEIVLHEMGHSFSGLADEYWAGSQYASEKPNMTQQSNPSTIRWKKWLLFNGVGIYQYESPGIGWYRPHQNCRMRYLGNEFCPVCTEATIRKIYYLINPYDDYLPVVDTLVIEDSISFKINMIESQSNTLITNWYLNGILCAGNLDSLVLYNVDLIDGINNLVAKVIDTISLLRYESQDSNAIRLIKWTIISGSTGIDFIHKTSEFNLKVYPNPATDIINIEYSMETPDYISIIMLDINGRTLESKFLHPRKGEHNYRLNIEKYRAGVYLLRLKAGKKLQTCRILKL